MRANRRWQSKRKHLVELQRRDPMAAAAEREALREHYEREIKRRVYKLSAPSAWQLAERVKKYLDIDLTEKLVDLLQQVMKPTGRPKPTKGKVCRLIH
jgi:hypothetical protein